MAVSTVEETSPPSSTVNLKGERTYTRTFLVHTDGQATGPMAVTSALGIAYGTTYSYYAESDPAAVVTNISAQPDSPDGLGWRVVVEYGPWPETGPLAENPLLQPAEVSLSGRELEVPVERDRLGNLIKNSAGDPFNPTISKDDSRQILSITRNEAAPPMGFPRNSVNSVSVTIPGVGTFPPRTLKSMTPQATLQWHQNVPGFAYWKVTYQFEVNDRAVYQSDGETLIGVGWDAAVLDAGFRRLEPGDPSTRRVIEVDGEPAQDPVPLDGSGQPLDPDADPHWLAFRVYQEVDHGALLGFA